MLNVAANLEHVRSCMTDACAAAGRHDAVKLIAVSKTYPPEIISTAVDAGQLVFGESTAQEALPKIEQFSEHALEWHFIGHLQSNKAKHVPGYFSWLHSLDSLSLAQRLSRFTSAQNVSLNALIEVNITRDPAKHGVAPTDLFFLIEEILTQNLPGLALRGLMTIGPHSATPAQSRATFAVLRDLREQIKSRFALDQFTELSMGMSDDYVEGILEGSTMVRVGTALFGRRAYDEK